MSNHAEKVLKANNKKRLQIIICACLFSTILGLFFRILFIVRKKATIGFWSDWLWFILTSVLLFFITKMFMGMVKRDEDICMSSGILGYVYDILILSVISQGLAWISPKFWLIYVSIPSYGLYYLFKSQMAKSDEYTKPLTEQEKKMQEKMQQKADRQQQRRENRRNKVKVIRR
ncbi:putative SRP-independent targeting protein 2 [Monocercomonoides exilis]|uniref:putative SRP-independent targeting protein 2 n=1 Tax=Monocercomonoides exilis TaxID=2049356 RepID=UPI00355A127C|nr:putative SRP-independent targeting protein 2 [Monocercomonoides exilis]|eukprot:MONOS_10131.1-p1 / transcript=MONOS_10131.1 / gene=MONOS_10131 / organism=Monocercomonoides_exilis_PA203 / gene_product=unspecified product / transcript_product=unspecified product / location=Mono_scaffold00447:18193-19008(-) / protein_length=173 / sequence_SO=supercontig / SO=protein_coding / is_pseudo=false